MIELLTAILVIITAIYAFLTHRIAKASEASVDAVRAQSEAMTRPYVTVAPYIRPHTPFLYLRVENTGRTGAENLRLTIDRDFFQFGKSESAEANLRTRSAFTYTIDTFAPGHQLNFALGQGWVIFGENARPDVTPPQFNVTAEYEFRGRKLVEVHRIDLRPHLGSEGERDPIVEELEHIRKAIEKKA
ncbi:MAG: hypothetical protein H0U23_10850 [Blastocatellia bacterium]|nr:hypothetical protein [Blastocatellia bacterium]